MRHDPAENIRPTRTLPSPDRVESGQNRRRTVVRIIDAPPGDTHTTGPEDRPGDAQPQVRDRLAKALIPLLGSDAIVWTTDVADLRRDRAIDLLTCLA